MARTRVRWGRVGVASTCTVLAMSFLAGRAGARVAQPPARPEPMVRSTYVVKAGDTLWDIASRLAGPHMDPRPLVDRLASANQVRQGLIHAGEVLVVPVG